MAGWLGAAMTLPAVFGLFAGLTLLAVGIAAMLWPSQDPEVVAHEHDELPMDHPHRAIHVGASSPAHAHAFVIDDLHPHWPAR